MLDRCLGRRQHIDIFRLEGRLNRGNRLRFRGRELCTAQEYAIMQFTNLSAASALFNDYAQACVLQPFTVRGGTHEVERERCFLVVPGTVFRAERLVGTLLACEMIEPGTTKEGCHGNDDVVAPGDYLQGVLLGFRVLGIHLGKVQVHLHD